MKQHHLLGGEGRTGSRTCGFFQLLPEARSRLGRGVTPFLPLPSPLGFEWEATLVVSPPHPPPTPPSTPTPTPNPTTLRLTASGWEEVGSKSQDLEGNPSPGFLKRTQNQQGSCPFQVSSMPCLCSLGCLRISYTHLKASCLVLECGERAWVLRVRRELGLGEWQLQA